MFSKNSKEFYYGIGTDIVSEGIFERFPELIPAVGENYDRADGKHKRLMFVGESNYFPDYPETVSVFQDAEKWYKGKTDKLIPPEKEIDVRNDIGYRPFVRVFDIANNLLRDNGIEPGGDRIYETGFYNYFLRPALNRGAGFKKNFVPKPVDSEVAGTALCAIIERLRLQVVVFVSKKSFNDFNQYMQRHNISFDNVYIGGVVHPSSIWWNRNNGSYGREKLRTILKEHWIN